MTLVLGFELSEAESELVQRSLAGKELIQQDKTEQSLTLNSRQLGSRNSESEIKHHSLSTNKQIYTSGLEYRRDSSADDDSAEHDS